MLQPLPKSVSRLAELIASDADIDALTAVIRFDPALTGRLLQATNSAVHGRQRRIGNVQEAVVRLGRGAIVALAVAGNVNKGMSHAVKEYELQKGQLWRHSVATALATEIIALKSKQSISSESFTAGLLHDIGKLLLGEKMGPEAVRFLARARGEGGLGRCAAEIELLSVHHGELGAIIAQHWGLPQLVVQAIQHHHSPNIVSLPEVDAVHLANIMAHLVITGAPCSERDGPCPEALSRLGFTTSSLDPLCDRVLRRYERLSAMFYVN